MRTTCVWARTVVSTSHLSCAVVAVAAFWCVQVFIQDLNSHSVAEICTILQTKRLRPKRTRKSLVIELAERGSVTAFNICIRHLGGNAVARCDKMTVDMHIRNGVVFRVCVFHMPVSCSRVEYELLQRQRRRRRLLLIILTSVSDPLQI